MLVLKRSTNEEIYCEVAGVVIRIVVADCGSNYCKLGIDAPAEVKIGRDMPHSEHKAGLRPA